MITFTFIAPFPLLSNGAMQKQFDVVEKEINSNLLFKKLKLSYALKFTIITKLRILKNLKLIWIKRSW